MADDIYLRVDATHPSWRGIVESQCRARHKEYGAHRELSMTMNVAGTEALIKVRGGDTSWRDARSWKGAITAVYTRESIKTEFWPEFYSPVWQPPDTEP
ncbi:MAG: hypothetical protein QGF59_05470 [Pirellulaceae bacterium]|jgi:hypothetical protein|nr:hypothetical protein [Pirellulaceae bacterium]